MNGWCNANIFPREMFTFSSSLFPVFFGFRMEFKDYCYYRSNFSNTLTISRKRCGKKNFTTNSVPERSMAKLVIQNVNYTRFIRSIFPKKFSYHFLEGKKTHFKYSASFSCNSNDCWLNLNAIPFTKLP